MRNNSQNPSHVKETVLLGASFILSAIVLALLLVNPLGARAESSRAESRSYIVTFEESVVNRPNRKTEDLEEQLDFEARDVYGTALEGFSADLSGSQVRELEKLDSVISVTPNYRIYKLGWQNRRRGEEVPAGIERVGAATATKVRQAGAGVAIIDDGIDLNHPDLNALHGKNCSSAAGSSSMPDEGNSHGTHVAGTVGAKNNGRGVVGVAPGTPVYSVKVFSGEGATWNNVICGIEWVAENAERLGIDVANMSLGGEIKIPSWYPSRTSCETTPDPLRRAICNLRKTAGVTTVVAAGNEGASFDERPSPWAYSDPVAPAVYPEVITVTSMSDSDGDGGEEGPFADCVTYYGSDERHLDDWYSDFSNTAQTPLGRSHTVAAPGACIKSTVTGNRYGYATGTSFASPHVAGLVAACYSENGTPGRCAGLDPDEVIDLVVWESKALGQSEPAKGFIGDPLNPMETSGWKFYGHLAPSPVGLPRPSEGYPRRHVPETGIASVRKNKNGGRRLWTVKVRGYGLNAVYGTSLNRLECQVNRKGREGAWRPCDNGKVTTRLGKGRHIIQIRAIAENGLEDPSPARQVVRLGR